MCGVDGIVKLTDCKLSSAFLHETKRRCHVNHRVTSLWAPTPEIMQRSSLAATVSSRRRGIGGVFGGRPDGVGR